MIESIDIKNFGPLADFAWSGLGSVNLVIGRHGTGKTFLLKALYCAIRTLEERRGDEPRTHAEILSDKLYWTFQPDRIGDLVRHGSNAELSVSLMLRDEILVNTPPSPVRFAFDRAAERSAIHFEGGACVRDARSIFIPAKEILSLQSVILRSRESDRMFGFDDTYVDLAKALSWPRDRIELAEPAKGAMAELEERVGGHMRMELKPPPDDLPIPRWVWRLKANGADYPVGMAAEGTRKIGILYALFLNRQLGHNSIIFIDEPEAGLHPEAISAFIDLIAALVEVYRGRLQFFIASHSYFVVKKLYLIAQQKGLSVPIAMADGGQWQMTDLRDGMPANPIIDESIRLYEQEVELALK